MVDQPDKKPLDDRDQQPEEFAGWHEPPVEEGSSRPVDAESWYTPENAVSGETASPPATPESGELPGTTPEQAGAWHTPIDARLDALLSGAADTIAEVHESLQPSPESQVSEDTQAQSLADTQVQPAGEDQSETRILTASEQPPSAQPIIQEPAVTPGSTPTPESTPPQPISAGLTPAEAALLAEQRAAGQRAAPQTPAICSAHSHWA